jgi:multimeric flavodoxin WrbA
MAQAVMRRAPRVQVDFLDLSLLASQPGRRIFPCKACVSTAMPLCHWPCSCYPNHALAQTGDWMAELYPRWAAAHGVMIVCPVHWYQAPSVLKLMIDRSSAPTAATRTRRPRTARIRNAPRPWSCAAGTIRGTSRGASSRWSCTATRRAPARCGAASVDWLTDMGLVPAGPQAQLDRYIGYWHDYATSHDDLDADRDVQEEVRNAARELVNAVRLQRRGACRAWTRG